MNTIVTMFLFVGGGGQVKVCILLAYTFSTKILYYEDYNNESNCYVRLFSLFEFILYFIGNSILINVCCKQI